jgi:hypothetical protein
MNHPVRTTDTERAGRESHKQSGRKGSITNILTGEELHEQTDGWEVRYMNNPTGKELHKL